LSFLTDGDLPCPESGYNQRVTDNSWMRWNNKPSPPSHMLRLPFAEDGMEAGCNFACVLTLCSLIAGASTIFYEQSGSNRDRFRGVLNDYYPWSQQPKGGASQAESVTALYSDYRNPLAHAWAVSTKETGKHSNKRVIIDGSAKVLGVIKGLSENNCESGHGVAGRMV
jgi:hypothetical protein